MSNYDNIYTPQETHPAREYLSTLIVAGAVGLGILLNTRIHAPAETSSSSCPQQPKIPQSTPSS